MKTSISTIFLLLFSYSYVAGQPVSPDLELDSIRIVGKDTRVFAITGDRYSTVDFLSSPIILPREERDMEASKGLIGEDERLHRREDFTVEHGSFLRADALSGINTPLIFQGKASLDLKGKAATISLSNRLAEENTTTNRAPLQHDVEAAGYYDTSFARFSVDGAFGFEDEKIGGKYFRNHMRDATQYGAGAIVRFSPFETWDASGRFRIEGAGYADKDIGRDDDEFIMSGAGSASGDFGATTVKLHASGNYLKIGEDYGMISSARALGEWLFGGCFGLKAGASLTQSAMPDEDTETSPRLFVEADWAITPDIYFKAAFKPEVISHSFTELYRLNGLVTYDVPMLFEDRKIDVSGEFGIRLSPKLKGSIEGFYIKSDNMPIFSLKDSLGVHFYKIVKGSEVELSGVRLNASYEIGKNFAVDGSLKWNDSSWNFSDNVPYIPDMEAVLNSSYRIHRFWRFYGIYRYSGKHYTDASGTLEEDGFFTIDLGVERELWKQYLSAYIELRNLTGQKGAWWTSRYLIPGAGFYAGLKANY